MLGVGGAEISGAEVAGLSGSWGGITGGAGVGADVAPAAMLRANAPMTAAPEILASEFVMLIAP